jgi:hypothetical protein
MNLITLSRAGCWRGIQASERPGVKPGRQEIEVIIRQYGVRGLRSCRSAKGLMILKGVLSLVRRQGWIIPSVCGQNLIPVDINAYGVLGKSIVSEPEFLHDRSCPDGHIVPEIFDFQYKVFLKEFF